METIPLFKRNKTAVEIGDRFVKIDDPKTVWVVAGKGSAVAPVPHYQVVREGYESRVRTLSIEVLLDADFYRRIE